MSRPSDRDLREPAISGTFEAPLLQATQAYLAQHAEGETPTLDLVAAWERFYQLHDPLIRRCIGMHHVTEPDLSDCVQEVWKDIVAGLGHFVCDPARASVRTWIITLAHHKAVDVVRRRARHPHQSLSPELASSLPDHDGDPALCHERLRTVGYVHRMLDALAGQVSDRSYQVLVLRSIEERPVPDVAARLGITSEQVRFRHCRAKRELRRLVEATLEDRDAR